MDVNMDTQESHVGIREAQQPLLENAMVPHKTPKTRGQRALRKTFKGTANLSKLLPTETVIAFQILSPIFTHQGQCHTLTSQAMILGLLTLCSISCFLVCFTDSFRDERGKVRYGVASLKGLWVMDASVMLPAGEAAKYRLRFIDFINAFMSILVFAAVAMFDENVLRCFVPKPSEEAKELSVALPAGIGVVCSSAWEWLPLSRN